jgi:hypothetical protein
MHQKIPSSLKLKTSNKKQNWMFPSPPPPATGGIPTHVRCKVQQALNTRISYHWTGSIGLQEGQILHHWVFLVGDTWKNSISSRQRIRDLRQQRKREKDWEREGERRGEFAAATFNQSRFRLTSEEIKYHLNVRRQACTKLINSRLTIAVNKIFRYPNKWYILLSKHTLLVWRSWLRHCATSRKVAGSISDGDIGIFRWHNPHYGPGVDSTSDRNEYQEYFLGIKAAAGMYGWQTYHLHVPIVLKSGNLNHLEPSGPVQACNGIPLPLPLHVASGTSCFQFSVHFVSAPTVYISGSRISLSSPPTCFGRYYSLLQDKGKGIPLQAWTGPKGFKRLRLPDFKTIGTWKR